MELDKSFYVHGEWRRASGALFESMDPVHERVVWRGAASDAGDVDMAIGSARDAVADWYLTGLDRRIEIARKFSRILERRVADISRCVATETGKALWDCEQELGASVGKIEISIRALQQRSGSDRTDEADSSRELRHKPHGVVAVFGPFNFPVHLPNGHIVPALLAGNTVVYKPSEMAPRSASIYVDCWREAGLPAGVLNVVNGAKETGEAIVDHPGLDGLFFTGSAQTGEAIHRRFAGKTGKILALELGGNNPLVVTRTNDIDAAALVIVQSAFATSGQRCTCARRLIVVDSDANRTLIVRLCEIMDDIVVGDPLESPQPFYGSLVSRHAADAIVAHQDRLAAMGATLLRPCRRARPWPAVLHPGLVDVSAIDDVPDEEAFGPLLQLRWVRDLESAIDEANRTRFGLSAGILCEDPAEWEQFLVASRAGIVNRNLPLTGASSAMPFGGIGASGNLRPSAYYAADYCAYPVASMARISPARPISLPPGVSL
ncbi:MAG: succinylglutamate-semialdehyde dehydrogenase [Proteobacteria bacterium]|nr:MAG: succinylglutamate-semialdehyde dehydrogenase [Pseudomonadota bacterium]